MNVLSLFDGMATGLEALLMAGISIDNYYASEIDKRAIDFTKWKYGDKITHLGDIRQWHNWDIDFSGIDLIIGGPPCQDLSGLSYIPGDRVGINGSKSSLFFYFADILDYVRNINQRIKFLMENVYSMSKRDKSIISDRLGVRPMLINSIYFAPQHRRRYYWSNINTIIDLFGGETFYVDLPKRYCKPLRLCSGCKLLSGKPYARTLISRYYSTIHTNNVIGFFKHEKYGRMRISMYDVVVCNNSVNDMCIDGEQWRLLSIKEMLQVQGFPEDHFAGYDISPNAACKMLGNGWTLPLIVHIFKYLSNTKNKNNESDKTNCEKRDR